jgi:hypothetical protein
LEGIYHTLLQGQRKVDATYVIPQQVVPSEITAIRITSIMRTNLTHNANVRYATGLLLMGEQDGGLIIPYPQTCVECPDRGEIKVFGHYLQPDRIKLWESETQQWEWKNLGWPKRCKSCNARAQAYKRAKKSIQRLEELREMTQDAFGALKGAEDRWCYLKFVTLTWKNELSAEKEPDMKKARKWLRKKREKIIEKLDCVAGTDVLECVTTEKDGLYHHHVHSHGIWIMPYHPIEYVGEIMKKYVGRDQCRAIKPIWIESENENGGYTMSAFAQARNYLMKYLTKEEGTRRGLWGFARRGLTSENFYGKVSAIHEKWKSADSAKNVHVL